MLTEEKLQPIFDSINPNNKTVSILMQTVIKRDGVEISTENHRCAFIPGDIEKVKAFLSLESSPEIDYLASIWTDEAIGLYFANIEQEDIE